MASARDNIHMIVAMRYRALTHRGNAIFIERRRRKMPKIDHIDFDARVINDLGAKCLNLAVHVAERIVVWVSEVNSQEDTTRYNIT